MYHCCITGCGNVHATRYSSVYYFNLEQFVSCRSCASCDLNGRVWLCRKSTTERQLVIHSFNCFFFSVGSYFEYLLFLFLAHSFYFLRTFFLSISLLSFHSDPGSLNSPPPLPPPPHYGMPFIFIARTLQQHFLPSSTRIELRLPTGQAPSASSLILFLFLQRNSKVRPTWDSKPRTNPINSSIRR